MSIKERIIGLIPSVRMGNHILARCDKIEQMLKDLDYKNEYMFWLSQKLMDEMPIETKKRVFLEMPKATGRLREIQLKTLHILEIIKDICDSNSIDYFLYAGTLLGAVRHHGFIPWDDDVDIGMMCNDYQRFQQASLNHPEIEVKCYYSRVQNSAYSIVKAKLKDDDTVFVDVYLFDYVSAERFDSNTFSEKLNLAIREFNDGLLRIMNEEYPETFVFNKPLPNQAIDQKAGGLKASILRKYDFLGKGEYIAKSFENTAENLFILMPYEEAFPLVKLEFEGKEYFAWSNYNNRLTELYGDYYALPRKVQPHHLNEIDW